MSSLGIYNCDDCEGMLFSMPADCCVSGKEEWMCIHCFRRFTEEEFYDPEPIWEADLVMEEP